MNTMTNFFGSDNNQNIDYLELIQNNDARIFLANFFEKSVIKNIPSKTLLNLVNYINEDVEKGLTFSTKEINVLDEKYLNSNTHKTFLSIIKNFFGKDAYNLLKDRKNLSIFNLKEIHVLHKEIFDNLGEKFVNTILNYNLHGALTTIPKLLNDKNEMNTFKYFYNFYTKNIGIKPQHYDNLFIIYDKYNNLLKSIVENKIHLTSNQEKILKQLFKDNSNTFSINTIEDVNNFYNIKNLKYQTLKAAALESESESLLKEAIISNFFALKPFEEQRWNPFSRDLNTILKSYDLESIIDGSHQVKDFTFNAQEIDIIKDFLLMKSATYDDLLKIGEKYEKIGNTISEKVNTLIDKLPLSFEKSMLNSITKISELENKIEKQEEGILKGEIDGMPSYTLQGTEFAFIQSTSFSDRFYDGLSSNKIIGDYAESWFTYENGSGHISCSYINHDKLCGLEFSKDYISRDKLTYIFDANDILNMSYRDIYTTTTIRSPIALAGSPPKFMSPDKLIEQTDNEDFFYSSVKNFDYNEVAINRYDPNANIIKFGGKIIPAAILVNEKIEPWHIEASKSFTNFLIANGLKPEGYKMPIIIVKTKVYEQMQTDKKRKMISQETLDEQAKENTIKSSQKNTNIVQSSFKIK